MDITQTPLTEIVKLIKSKKISSVEAAQHFASRIEKHDSKFNSFISLNEKYIDEAKKIDTKISKGEDPGLLAGVPFGIKDLLCTKGLKTTAGSKILHNFIPPYDSTVVAKLKNQGTVVLGKTNLDEFAMGSSNETSFYGVCKNPWDAQRVAGGSSGGSAAAVAARLVPATIGTDTGGSIRQPASFCHLVGVKPTYGRVSRYGIVAFASSLDQAGPMTTTVEDSALILEAICGHDPKDATTAQESVPAFSQKLDGNMKGYKIGLVKEYKLDALDSDTQKVFDQAVEHLKKLGAEVVEVIQNMRFPFIILWRLARHLQI